MTFNADILALFLHLAALCVLPGAWIAFVPRLRSVDFGERFALAVAASPVVVVGQFYALRAFGVGFEDVVGVIPWLNAPVALAVLLRLRFPDAARIGTAALALVTLAVPVWLLSWRYVEHDPEQVFTAHTLIHVDVIYMLARGLLVPEEAELAGVSIGYHWLGHIQPALLCARIDQAPPWVYLWMNHLWLGGVVVLLTKGAAHLGARTAASVAGILMVVLGVNAVGYAAGVALPENLVETLKLNGLGWTYTPWLWKFQMFNQVTVGLAMFAAVAHVSLRGFWTDLDRTHLVVALVLLLGLGLVYPVMFPIGGAAAGLSWLFAAARDLRSPATERRAGVGRYVVAAVGLAVVAALVVVNLELITADRSGDAVRFFERRGMAKKAYDLLWVFLPFVVVLRVVGARHSGPHGVGARFALASAAFSLAAYVFLGVGALTAENKFIFTAAVSLGPAMALALQRWFDRTGSVLAVITVLVTGALLTWPVMHKCERTRGLYEPPHAVDSSAFHMVLGEDVPLAAAARAIVAEVPAEAVLITRDLPVHLPTFVRRSAFAPTRPDVIQRGVGLPGGMLLVAVRGQDQDLVQGRLNLVRDLFRGGDGVRAEALTAISAAVERPLAVVLSLPRDEAFLRWLEGREGGRTIHRDSEAAVHLIL